MNTCNDCTSRKINLKNKININKNKNDENDVLIFKCLNV